MQISIMKTHAHAQGQSETFYLTDSFVSYKKRFHIYTKTYRTHWA